MNNWATWIANVMPLVLLVGLWVYFAKSKRFSWRRYQEKHLELLEQQVAALRQTNELLKRLVDAR